MKTIAVTMGDPCGIGPEIVLRAAADPEISSLCKLLVIGDRAILEKTARSLDIQGLSRHFWQNQIYHIECAEILPEEIGHISPKGGQAAFDCIKAAVDLAEKSHIHAVATAPINKEALRAAGVPHIGHTEIFGALTGTEDPLTMFETLGLRVFFLTRHLSLRQACEKVTVPRLLEYISRCTGALKEIGISSGRMAVAGLNPHCGEHGLFGSEEEAIYQAVEQAQKLGFPVEGPIGADSVFHLVKIGRYCAVLSLYHDQGHIATKTLDFERTIAITLGLPFLRTSVDHGTAFDIAGKGIASAVSMKEAIRLAAKYQERRFGTLASQRS